MACFFNNWSYLTWNLCHENQNISATKACVTQRMKWSFNSRLRTICFFLPASALLVLYIRRDSVSIMTDKMTGEENVSVHL
jgi:hypothetical protein